MQTRGISQNCRPRLIPFACFLDSFSNASLSRAGQQTVTRRYRANARGTVPCGYGALWPGVD
jgi:hypothetical protein